MSPHVMSKISLGRDRESEFLERKNEQKFRNILKSHMLYLKNGWLPDASK